MPLAPISSCCLLQTRFLSQWNQVRAFKQQRSLGAFSRHKLGPAHHSLSCSHTAACLLRVWMGFSCSQAPTGTLRAPLLQGECGGKGGLL